MEDEIIYKKIRITHQRGNEKKKARKSINQMLNDEIEIIQFKKIPTKRSIHVNLRNQ
jgi:hypothetical protein